MSPTGTEPAIPRFSSWCFKQIVTKTYITKYQKHKIELQVQSFELDKIFKNIQMQSTGGVIIKSNNTLLSIFSSGDAR